MERYPAEDTHENEREFWSNYINAIEELCLEADPELNFHKEMELVKDEDEEDAQNRIVNTYLNLLGTSDDLDDAIQFAVDHHLLEIKD